MREINSAGLDLIKQFEGCELTAYRDVAGIWTIGYGHTKGVAEGMQITQAQADQALLDDLSLAQSVVEVATNALSTSDNQFAAMVSLCFNIGSLNYRSSTVLRDHNAGEFSGAATAFLMFNKAWVGGKLQEVAGLTARRHAESELYKAQ